MTHRIALLLLLAGLLTACRRDPVPTATERAAFEQQLKKTRESDQKWFNALFLGGYEQHGQHGPWDESVTAALKLLVLARTSGAAPDDWQETVSRLAAGALNAGCGDPLVRYLAYRYGTPNVRRANADTAQELQQAARDLQNSDYAPSLKFYAALRAAEALKANATNTPPEVHEMRHSARSWLLEQLADPATPTAEVQAMTVALFEAVRRNASQWPEFWPPVEEALMLHWRNDPVAHLLKGWYFYEWAWGARGGGYANTVSEDAWRLFGERLKIAEAAYREAARLAPADPRAATEMIGIATGKGLPRAEMERWFRAAMAAAPDNFEAVQKKLNYLQPKWHGSAEELLAFGRECLTNRAWKGQAPLGLAEAHRYLAGHYEAGPERTRYWRHPEVWPEVQRSFDTFFSANPEAVSWKHNLAWFAFQCGQWDVFNQTAAEFPSTNYAYFGGRRQFELMLATARERASKPSAR